MKGLVVCGSNCNQAEYCYFPCRKVRNISVTTGWNIEDISGREVCALNIEVISVHPKIDGHTQITFCLRKVG